MPTNVASLRRGFAGQVLLPDEAGYGQARRVWNAMVDRRPAVIARCAGTADVAAAVRFGRDRGLEIGVRGRRPQHHRPGGTRGRPDDRAVADGRRPR